ncbi:MAG: hypothetical protein RL660_1204 [Bacteroidota bacterium]|jgi:hypothetical protein
MNLRFLCRCVVIAVALVGTFHSGVSAQTMKDTITVDAITSDRIFMLDNTLDVSFVIPHLGRHILGGLESQFKLDEVANYYVDEEDSLGDSFRFYFTDLKPRKIGRGCAGPLVFELGQQWYKTQPICYEVIPPINYNVPFGMNAVRLDDSNVDVRCFKLSPAASKTKQSSKQRKKKDEDYAYDEEEVILSYRIKDTVGNYVMTDLFTDAIEIEGENGKDYLYEVTYATFTVFKKGEPFSIDHTNLTGLPAEFTQQKIVIQ